MSLDTLCLRLCMYDSGTADLQCRQTSVFYFSYSAQEIALPLGNGGGFCIFFPLQVKQSYFSPKSDKRGWWRWLKGTFFLFFSFFFCWHFKRWAVFSAVLHTSECPLFERYLISWFYCILKYSVCSWWFPEALPILLTSLVRNAGVKETENSLLSELNESGEAFGRILLLTS